MLGRRGERRRSHCLEYRPAWHPYSARTSKRLYSIDLGYSREMRTTPIGSFWARVDCPGFHPKCDDSCFSVPLLRPQISKLALPFSGGGEHRYAFSLHSPGLLAVGAPGGLLLSSDGNTVENLSPAGALRACFGESPSFPAFYQCPFGDVCSPLLPKPQHTLFTQYRPAKHPTHPDLQLLPEEPASAHSLPQAHY